MQVLSFLLNIKNEILKSKSFVMCFGCENLDTIEALINEIYQLKEENNKLRNKIFKLENK